MTKKSPIGKESASVGNDLRSATSVASGSQVENVTGQAGTAVETVEVECDEDIELDQNLEDTILWKHVAATVETLYRQKGRFFLGKEYLWAVGEDAAVEDCTWEDSDWEPLSATQAEAWLEHNCGQRDDVAQKIAELDERDGIGSDISELKHRIDQLLDAKGLSTLEKEFLLNGFALALRPEAEGLRHKKVALEKAWGEIAKANGKRKSGK